MVRSAFGRDLAEESVIIDLGAQDVSTEDLFAATEQEDMDPVELDLGDKPEEVHGEDMYSEEELSEEGFLGEEHSEDALGEDVQEDSDDLAVEA